MTAYYNEIDPYCVEWLRNLIKEGHIADGIVDDRSIEDVTPNDLKGFTQCHWFSGIGLWSLALRRAGWADDRPVWTGSCPCQPFSAAGEGKGFVDERHLWPAWNHIISQCRPVRIFGEQVASKDGLGWLDLVQTDLEREGYAVGATDICAAGFGAFHIRQRLYFTGMADADDTGPQGRGLLRERGDQRITGAGGLDGHGLADADRSGRGEISVQGPRQTHGADSIGAATKPSGDGGLVRLADTDRGQRDGVAEVGGGHVIDGAQTGWIKGDGIVERSGAVDGLADATGERSLPGAHRGICSGEEGPGSRDVEPERSGAAYWVEHAARLGWVERGAESGGRGIVGGCESGGLADADGGDTSAEREQRSRELGLYSWCYCRDGKYRPIPVEPEFFPVVDVHPNRVGKLRAYGNGIHVETATRFIEAAMSACTGIEAVMQCP